jgi:DNA end-binding protein Ku
MHALWTGSLSFGLINIPVIMYSASKDRALSFSMLHRDDLGPISYKKICQKNGEEVPHDQIVKGFEYKEGKYVILEDEDFKRAAAEKSDTIDIEEFVLMEEIDSKYYEKPYYLEPGKSADKAYVLLREALAQEKRVAVARMVFHGREDLAIVRADGDLLILNQLRYNDELRDAKELKIPKDVSLSHKEVAMAVELIEKMHGKFSPEKYEDTYAEKLEKVIKAKARGEKVQPLPKVAKVVEPTDLVAQLRASLERSRT